MNKKLTTHDATAIQLAYDTFKWALDESNLRSGGHHLKKVDFCRRTARVYHVHWKSIERIIRK